MSTIKEKLLAKIDSLGDNAHTHLGVSKQSIVAWKNGKADALLNALESLDVEQESDTPSICKESQDHTADMQCDPFSWEGKSLIILMPSYRQTNPDTMFHVFCLKDTHGPSIGIDSVRRTMIVKARNVLLTRFMQLPHKPEWAFFIDDDMILPTGRPSMMRSRYNLKWDEKYLAKDAITQLLSRRKTLVGGLYFGRAEGAPAMYAEAWDKNNKNAHRENQEARNAPIDKIKPTASVGTGCMLIHRSCVEAIEKKFPDIMSKDPSRPNGYFTPENAWAGEDTAFCWRAKQSGHQPYVDFSVVCGHVGTYTYWPHNNQK